MDNAMDKQINYVKGAIEALLFVSDNPVSMQQLKDALETVEIKEVKIALEALQDEYAQRGGGMQIVEIADGYQMMSNAMFAVYVRNFYKTKYKEKLSKPALESIAIIAYKQPVTRGDIELIRGVNSDGVVAHLLSKELIKVVGRKEVAGRPFLYGTSKKFLEYFGLRSLEDLPRLEEFAALVEARQEAPESDERVSSQDSEGAAVRQESLETQTSVADSGTSQEPPITEEAVGADAPQPSLENQELGDESLKVT